MEELQPRVTVRDRILYELRNVVKQIYYDSVNNELNSENKTYLCIKLIKHLDEALCHGLKQLHLGYWKAIENILHPEFLYELEKIPKYNGLESNYLCKGRTWIAVALQEDCFVNYIRCMTTESCISKFYENWSILCNNDTCNRFISILSGLDNINFVFEIDFINKPPSYCSFNAKVISDESVRRKFQGLSLSKCSVTHTASSSSLTSPVDSGVHIQDSSSDMEQLPEDKCLDIDFLNGNIPESGCVTRRKHKKDKKRHVSFHEDIIYKSPDKCRKLKWDCENLRYSWSGEELDSSIIVNTNFGEIKSQIASDPGKVLDINERGAPEGEETPCNLENLKELNKAQKSVIVKRFLQSINKQSKIKQSSKKYCNVVSSYQFFNIKIDEDVISGLQREINAECEANWKTSISKYEISLNSFIIEQMIKNETIYKAYKLRDFLFIITNENIYCINKLLETKKISLDCIKYILIYPDSHIFWLWDLKCHKFATGDEELTNEIMGRLELCMRRNNFELPQFHILHHSDLSFLRRRLMSRYVIGKKETFVYCGLIQLDKELEPIVTRSETSKRGFLMYRDQRGGDGWIPGDFFLKGSILYLYSDGLPFPKFAINMANSCRSCSRTLMSGRPHTFQVTIADEDDNCQNEENIFYDDSLLKSKIMKPETQKLLSEIRQKVNKLFNLGSHHEKSSVVLEFAAANEQELSAWMQMFIQASCEDYAEDASAEEITEGTLILTEDSLVVINDLFSGNQIEILSRARISDIACIKFGADTNDLFVLIEFSCMEATSTPGDWIIFMSSRVELEKLGTVLQRLWHLDGRYPCGYLTEERLINKCRKTQGNLSKNYWTHLLQ